MKKMILLITVLLLMISAITITAGKSWDKGYLLGNDEVYEWKSYDEEKVV